MDGETFQGKGRLGLAEVEEELARINKRYALLEGEISSLSVDIFSFPCGGGLIGVSEEKINGAILRVQETLREKQQELAKLKERREALEKLKADLGGERRGWEERTKKASWWRKLLSRIAQANQEAFHGQPLSCCGAPENNP